MLPSETNIISDVKKLLRLSSDGNERDDDGTDSIINNSNSSARPMFRTMKMDVNKENNRMPFGKNFIAFNPSIFLVQKFKIYSYIL